MYVESIIRECPMFRGPIEITDLNRLGFAKVFKVNDGYYNYKVRLNSDRSDSADCEAKVLTLLNEHYPGDYPQIYYKSDRLLVEDFVEGVPLDYYSGYYNVDNFIYNFDKLHTIETRCTDFSTVYHTWYDQIYYKIYNKMEIIPGLLDDRQMYTILNLLNMLRDELSEVRPVLIHGDIKPSNIIIQDNTYFHFIDFESCIVGDVDYDLSMLIYSTSYGGVYAKMAERAVLKMLGDYAGTYLTSTKHMLYMTYFYLHWACFAISNNMPTQREAVAGLNSMLKTLDEYTESYIMNANFM